MEFKPGSRWKSSVCQTQLVVVAAPISPVVVECGGQPIIALAEEPPTNLAMAPSAAAGTLVGKRYYDKESGLELLCSKGGKGSLSVDGRPLPIKEAKKLPSSD